MTPSEIKELFAKRQEDFVRRDPAALASYHSEDCVAESPMVGTIKGRAAVQALYQDIFKAFQDMEVLTEELLIGGQRAAQFFSWKGTHTGEFCGLCGTGRRFELRGVLLCSFKKKQIVYHRSIYDFTGLLVQIGALKAKPGF